MPMYAYHCDTCDTTIEVSKPMSESDKPELCSICNKIMRRDFTYGTASFKCDMSHTASEGRPVQQHPNTYNNYKMGKYKQSILERKNSAQEETSLKAKKFKEKSKAKSKDKLERAKLSIRSK